MKKLIPIITAAISLTLFSFLDHQMAGTSSDYHGKITSSDSLNPMVYKLYIDNSGVGSGSSTKFQDLISAITDNKIKLVFQFYFDNGKLTLMAYPGPKNHQTDFNTSLEIELSIYDDCPAMGSIDGKLASLGDLEVKNENANIPKLQTLALSKYILFIPSVITNAGITTISYSMVGVDTMDKAAICKMTKNSLLSALNINPSPPRKGN